jgi:ATP-dependent Lhr-like helicase
MLEIGKEAVNGDAQDFLLAEAADELFADVVATASP